MFTLQDAFDLCGLREIVRFQIENTYSQEHRLYHNLKHIENMLRWVPEAKKELDYELPILVNAILFHDLIYLAKPVPKGYNECLSAIEYMVQELWLKTPFLEGQLFPNIGSRMFEAYVVEAINASAYPSIMQANLRSTSEWLLDLDLQSFGQDWDEWHQDNTMVLEEMRVIGIQDPEEKNIKFLQDLIKRPRIFYKMTGWEEKARENINRKLDLLKTPQG